MLIGIFLTSVCMTAQEQDFLQTPVWQEGYLDIHHILYGNGNSTFVIMPDGTNMLIDAGDIGDKSKRIWGNPLTATDPYPNAQKSAAERIVEYIKRTLPKENVEIDYAVITHFHDDHMGIVNNETPFSKYGKYRISGITEIGDLTRIKTLIDRNYPHYDFPTDLKNYYNKEPGLFLNYLNFLEYKKQKGLKIESLEVGSKEQIILKHNKPNYPLFKITGLKKNGEIWKGKSNRTINYFTPKDALDKNNKFDENPMSLALKISYGKFDYYTGGDNTGIQESGKPKWVDVETPISKAVGKVEVAVLNHHGVRDAVNENWLRNSQPQAVIQQSWSSNHPGEEVVHRLINRNIVKKEIDIFALEILEATKQTIGFWLTNNYKSTFGHIIVRVLPGGNSYYIMIAESDQNYDVKIRKVFGPYICF